MENNNIITALNDLLTRCYDAEKGYTEAAEQVRSDSYKDMFSQYALQRKRFGKQLKDEIKSLGGTPDTGTSIKADLHRIWIDMRGAIAQHDENDILAECERGEKEMIDTYEEVLNETTLPWQTRGLVMDQLAAVHSSLERMRSLNLISA